MYWDRGNFLSFCNLENMYILFRNTTDFGSVFIHRKMMMEENIIDTTIKKENKMLLDIDEFCECLGIGKTKARELLKTPRNGFALKIGSKWYVHKGRLEEWLLKECDKY